MKIDALKGVDTERTTGETSEALTLTCVAGAGLFFRAKEEQQQQKKHVKQFGSLNICVRGREGAFTDKSRTFCLKTTSFKQKRGKVCIYKKDSKRISVEANSFVNGTKML